MMPLIADLVPMNRHMVADPPRSLRGFLAAWRNGIRSGFPPCCILVYSVLNYRGIAAGAWQNERMGHHRHCWPVNHDRVLCPWHLRRNPPLWRCASECEVDDGR